MVKIELVSTIIVLVSVVDDMIRYKISNVIILAGYILGICGMIHYCNNEYVFDKIIGAIVPIVFLGGLYFIKVLGAGDIKLFSVVGILLGAKFVYNIIIVSFIYGAVFALLKMLYYKNLFYRLQYLANYFKCVMKIRKAYEYSDTTKIDTKNNIHFSVAIAVSFFGKMFLKF